MRAECGARGRRRLLSPLQSADCRTPAAALLRRPPPARVEGSMLAVGCTLLLALLAAPAVALVLGSCRALGKRSPSGRGECDTVWFGRGE